MTQRAYQTTNLIHTSDTSAAVTSSSVSGIHPPPPPPHSHLPASTRPTLCSFPVSDCLFGLVVKASASRAEDPEFESRLRRDFSGSGHTGDLKMDTPVATLPGAWRYRVSPGTGRPDVSLLCLGEVQSSICNFCLSVVARKIVFADPSLR